MLWTNRHQKEILPLVAAGPGERVLEIGYGAGGLARLLCATGARVSGVDPSPDMRLLAARRAAAADLRLGTASDTGFPDGTFGRVVSVNNVAIWPELPPALRELHRVTRPGGRVLIAWHGGSAPSRLARGLRMPEQSLARVRSSLGELFARVDREELSNLTVLIGHR